MKAFKKISDWYRGENDIEKEPPRSGIKRVLYILWNYTEKMIAINVIFLLSCIPIVTIPAAISALNAYVGKIFRVGYGMEYADYWKEYKLGMIKNLPLGVITGGMEFYAYYLLSLANNFSQSTKDVLTGVGIGVMVIAILLGSYVFVLTSIADLPMRHILRNALILIFLEWKISLLVVAEVIIFISFLLAAAPYSLILLILIGFSLQQLILCAMILPMTLKRVIIESE